MKIEISGIEELKKTINVNRIQKSIAVGVGQAAKFVHTELRSDVAQRYKTIGDLNSVLIRSSISDVTFGRGILKGGLEYKHVPVDLAKYFDSAELGNIPPVAYTHLTLPTILLV